MVKKSRDRRMQEKHDQPQNRILRSQVERLQKETLIREEKELDLESRRPLRELK